MLRSKLSGFTITEVTIVLVVASAILLVVLATVPGASRNQRDATRKGIQQRLISSLESYNGNKQGSYPFGDSPALLSSPLDCSSATAAPSCNDWYSNYVKNGSTEYFKIEDPSSGQPVGVFFALASASSSHTLQTINPSPWNPGDAYIIAGAYCDGGGAYADANGSKSSKRFAMLMELDTNGTWFCSDNR